MARIEEIRAQISEVEAMTENTKIAAYYASIAQHPFDGAGPGRLLTAVAIAYAIIAIGLAAMLVFSSAPGKAMQEPAGSHASSLASDLAAIPADLPIGVTDGAGYAGLEPPPAAPAGPFAITNATAKQAHEAREPSGVHNRVATRTANLTGE
jgi:hypothetical protein